MICNFAAPAEFWAQSHFIVNSLYVKNSNVLQIDYEYDITICSNKFPLQSHNRLRKPKIALGIRIVLQALSFCFVLSMENFDDE